MTHSTSIWGIALIPLIDFFDRLATPRMTDTQIEIIEKKLLSRRS
jgi:hypothetical protein